MVVLENIEFLINYLEGIVGKELKSFKSEAKDNFNYNISWDN